MCNTSGDVFTFVVDYYMIFLIALWNGHHSGRPIQTRLLVNAGSDTKRRQAGSLAGGGRGTSRAESWRRRWRRRRGRIGSVCPSARRAIGRPTARPAIGSAPLCSAQVDVEWDSSSSTNVDDIRKNNEATRTERKPRSTMRSQLFFKGNCATACYGQQ